MNGTEQTPPAREPDSAGLGPLLTIGYGARTPEEFMALLRAHEVEYLVDVRTSPYSKFKPEFSREILQTRVERAGMRYVFMGDTLGGQPKDPECYTDGKVDYAKVREQAFFLEGIARIKRAYQDRRRAVLMCSEGRPEQCHRCKLIGEVLAAEGMALHHIDEDGTVISQSEAIGRLTKGQMDLFGQPNFTSRKRYGPREGEEEG